MFQSFGIFSNVHLNLCEERRNDLLGDLILQIKNVLQFTVILLSPYVVSQIPVNQLSSDPDTISRLANATFKDVTNSKLSADLLDIYHNSSICKARVAGNNKQPRRAGQRCNNVLSEAIREIFLFRIATHVIKRQNGNGGFIW